MSNLGKSIAQLSVLVQSGTLDPRALAEETLDAIRSHPDQSIFTVLTPDRALHEAAASARRIREGRSLGILDGIPVGLKDLFDMEGLVTTAGSKVLARNAAALADAAIVEGLSAAGMVAVGRTNMSEFAFSGIGINPHYGTPNNPEARDAPRVPGGSSSGSGVAVAAGLLPAAIGTDTGGSIRIPAAFNGIVGYKATRGRYSMSGVFPLSKSLDSLGPLCRTVQDAIHVDAAMCGTTADIARGALAGQSFVVPETVFFDGIEDGVLTAFEAALERIAASGARIRRQPFPIFSQLFEMMAEKGALVTAEAFALHRERLADVEAVDMDQRVVQRARTGAGITAWDYIYTLEARERMIRQMADTIAADEILLSPTLPHVAPLLEPLLADDGKFFAANAKTLRNTLIGNFLDWCGVSIPCGRGEADMPVGCLLSGLPNTDRHLLSISLAVESALRDTAGV